MSFPEINSVGVTHLLAEPMRYPSDAWGDQGVGLNLLVRLYSRLFKSKLAMDWVSFNQWSLWFTMEVCNGGPLVSFLWAPRMGYLKREDTTCYSIRPGFVQGMSSWHFSVAAGPCWFGQNPLQLIKWIYISLNITRYHAHLQLLGFESSGLTLLATTVRFRVLSCQECPRQVLCQRSAQP